MWRTLQWNQRPDHDTTYEKAGMGRRIGLGSSFSRVEANLLTVGIIDGLLLVAEITR